MQLMFSTYTHIQINQDAIVKSQSSQYSIRSDGKLIGRIEESIDTSRDWKNQLLNLINLHPVSSKKLIITNSKGKVVAHTIKNRGFSKDIQIYDEFGSNFATLQQELKMRSQTLLAMYPDESRFLKATGGNGSLDFTVIDEESETEISRIKKRSISNPNFKESLFSGDLYHVNNHKQITERQQLVVVMMTIVISEQLHNA